MAHPYQEFLGVPPPPPPPGLDNNPESIVFYAFLAKGDKREDKQFESLKFLGCVYYRLLIVNSTIHICREEEQRYLKFISDVTTDILARGIFSNRYMI